MTAETEKWLNEKMKNEKYLKEAEDFERKRNPFGVGYSYMELYRCMVEFAKLREQAAWDAAREREIITSTEGWHGEEMKYQTIDYNKNKG